MPLVPAECTQCGATLEVDASSQSAICPFCKMAFITEKAINNYNTNYTTNIGNLHADIVNISDDNSRDSKVKSGDTFINMSDYKSAYKIFDDMANEHPYDYRGWWGIIRAHTKDLQDIHISRTTLQSINSIYEKMLAVSVPETIKSDFENYKKEVLHNLAFIDSDTKEQLSGIKQRAILAHEEKEKRTEQIKNKYLSVEANLNQSLVHKNKLYSKIMKVSKWAIWSICFILYALLIFGLIQKRILNTDVFLRSVGYFICYVFIIIVLFVAYKKHPIFFFIPALLFMGWVGIEFTINAIKQDSVVVVANLLMFGGLVIDIILYKLLFKIVKKRLNVIQQKIESDEKDLANLITRRNTEINQVVSTYKIEKERINTQIQNVEKVLNDYK